MHPPCSIVHSIFTALNILCAPLYITPANPWDPFTSSMVLPFPKCLRIGVIQCVVFSDWLLSLGNMHLIFLHVFSWFDISFLSSIE